LLNTIFWIFCSKHNVSLKFEKSLNALSRQQRGGGKDRNTVKGMKNRKNTHVEPNPPFPHPPHAHRHKANCECGEQPMEHLDAIMDTN
jgi:hypothetical protein